MKLLMLSGLPASGKSTEAQRIVGTGNWVRVNRDLLRAMLHFDYYSKMNEGIVVDIEMAVVRQMLNRKKQNVVIDDCNLNPKNREMWSGIAKECGATFETKFIDTDIEICVERDAIREKRVGAHVIRNMALQYSLPGSPTEAIICDIDGTVADIAHRRHHVEKDPKDWKSFYAELDKDTVRESTRELLDTLMEHPDFTLDTGIYYPVIFVSGRPEDYRAQTEKWLVDNGFGHYWTLIMRNKGDSRQDTLVKQEIYDKYFKNKKVVKVVDDRPSVIRMWKSNGLDVIDVGDGVEF